MKISDRSVAQACAAMHRADYKDAQAAQKVGGIEHHLCQPLLHSRPMQCNTRGLKLFREVRVEIQSSADCSAARTTSGVSVGTKLSMKA